MENTQEEGVGGKTSRGKVHVLPMAMRSNASPTAHWLCDIRQ